MISQGVLWAFLVLALLGLVLAWLAGSMRKARNEYRERWGNLAPLVDGTFKMATMQGTYNGYPLRAYVTVGQPGEIPIYEYNLLFTVPCQGTDWSVTYPGDQFLETVPAGWTLTCKNAVLKQRLMEACVLERFEAMPDFPIVSFHASEGELLFQVPAASAFDLPALRDFERQLEFMAGLAELNQQLNRATTQPPVRPPQEAPKEAPKETEG